MMSLHALSPLDGRYAGETAALREIFSDFNYLKTRVGVELLYLSALSNAGLYTSTDDEVALVALGPFTEQDALEIQFYEKTTRHDVKAIELYLREKLPVELHPYIHFGLTSEDINNIAQAMMLRDARDQVMLPALDGLLSALYGFSEEYRALPMLGRTHGQPAVPTTLGKEFAVYLERLLKVRTSIEGHWFEAKLSGAVGNFNALQSAAPQVDWISFSRDFTENQGLAPNPVTTQVLPADNWVRYFDHLRLANAVLIGLAQDVWRYVSDGYLRQKAVVGEVGSSTMPQKVNPIQFENAEGNLGIANALLAHYGSKLPVSRLQRDLSDSTVRRTFGVALGHTLLAWNNTARGMERLAADEEHIRQELNQHWEVVSEGAQTILRAAGRSDAFETLQALTRGRVLEEADFRAWVEAIDVDEATRVKLRGLSPETYIGLAVALTDDVLAHGRAVDIGSRSQ